MDGEGRRWSIRLSWTLHSAWIDSSANQSCRARVRRSLRRSAVPVCLTDCAAVHPLGRAALVAGNERVSTVCLAVVRPLFV